MMCGYKLVKCPACLSEMPQKNLPEHQLQCTSVLMKSENCQITYKPTAPSLHSEINYLREQFEHYRFAAQSEIQELRQELRRVQSNYFK
jgi:endoglucanase Acf2